MGLLNHKDILDNLDTKKKKIIVGVLGLIVIFLISGLLYFFFNKKQPERPVPTVVEKTEIKEKSSCSINVSFLYDLSFLEYREKKINIKKEKGIENTNILKCSKLLKKDENLINVVKSYIPTYAVVERTKDGLSFKELNKGYINNIIKEKKVGNKEPFFLYKEKTPFVIKFGKLLEGYKNIINVPATTRKISGINKLKYSKYFKMYGDEIIISNYKYYLDINPAEKHLLAKLSKNEYFQNMVDLEMIFNNSFVENNTFIIIKDIDETFKRDKQ